MSSESKPKKRKQRSRKDKPRKTRKKRSRKQRKKTQKTSIARCVPGCLLKLADFMGLVKISEKMKKIMNRNFDFNQVINTFTNGSDFNTKSISCVKFDPLLVDPGHIFVVQLCSRHVLSDITDNSHSVSLFDNKIFDWNFDQPLTLTQDNLDRCCLGEDWVYKHCSRVKSISIQSNKDKKV